MAATEEFVRELRNRADVVVGLSTGVPDSKISDEAMNVLFAWVHRKWKSGATFASQHLRVQKLDVHDSTKAIPTGLTFRLSCRQDCYNDGPASLWNRFLRGVAQNVSSFWQRSMAKLEPL